MAEFDLKSFLARIDDRLRRVEGRPALSTLQAVYPVGCIYISTTDTSPADLFGFGTWEAFGAGRVLVGKASEGRFATAGATGGAETSSSSHSAGFFSSGSVAGHTTCGVPHLGGTDWAGDLAIAWSDADHSVTVSTLQPYIVVYMWKRTA